MNNKLFVIYLILFVIVVKSYAAQETTLDKLIRSKTDIYSYLKTEDYKKHREEIRKELVIKYRQMIRQDRYDHFFEYIILAIDIADMRYPRLLRTIENKVHSYAGENIIGYAEFIQMKANGSTLESLVDKVAGPSMGSFLFSDVASYSIQVAPQLQDRLNIFNRLCEKVNYKYEREITGILDVLCSQNGQMTDDFIRKNQMLKNHLKYNCSNINKAP